MIRVTSVAMEEEKACITCCQPDVGADLLERTIPSTPRTPAALSEVTTANHNSTYHAEPHHPFNLTRAIHYEQHNNTP